MILTNNQLRAFIAACLQDGRPEARELAVIALEKLQARTP